MRTLYTGIVSPNVEYIHTPLIEIFPVADAAALHSAIDDWYGDCGNTVSYLLFTSQYGVRHWCGNLNGKAPQHSNPSKEVVSIGATTSKALREAGFRDFQQVDHDDSYGVIEWFRGQPRGKVTIPRSSLALDIIPQGLSELGFEVRTVTAYENRMPENIRKVDLDEIDEIIFTSPSTIDNFLKIYGQIPKGKTIKTRGKITEKHLNEMEHR